MRVLSLRAILLLGFVIAMPVLALPAVARRVDELLYGPPPDDFGRPGNPPPVQDPIPPVAAQPVAAASYLATERGPAAGYLAADMAPPRGIDAPPPSPPQLAPVPSFEPLAMPAQATEPIEPAIDPRTIARLQEIRDRLEQLGADYILVETAGDGRYRFHCRMLVDSRSPFTRPFEATSSDLLAAGEEVLRAVEAWRAGGAVGER